MRPPAPRPPDVPDRIVAALDRLGRGVRSDRQAIASRLGLTPLQIDLLQTIADAPPPEPITGRLATELGVSQPTVTDSLLALERKGHVARRRDPGDRRRTVVELTASGTRLLQQGQHAQQVLRSVVADLPDADQDTLLTALLDLIGGLLDADVIQVARTCTSCRFYDRASADTARCTLLQVSLAPADLRVNCPEHEPAATG